MLAQGQYLDGTFAAISALNPTDPVPKMAMLPAGTLVPEHSRDERPVRGSQISVTQIRVQGNAVRCPRSQHITQVLQLVTVGHGKRD